MYTAQALPIDRQRVELEVSLPGEGRERTFRVAIKVKHLHKRPLLFQIDFILVGGQSFIIFTEIGIRRPSSWNSL